MWVTVFLIGLIHLQGEKALWRVTILVSISNSFIIYSLYMFHRRARFLVAQFPSKHPKTNIFYDRVWTTGTGLGIVLFFTTYVCLIWILGPEWHSRAI